MNDLISRQAAIDALRMDIDIIPYAKAREYARAVIETVYNRLEELPSAQPEIIRCKDCKWFNDIGCAIRIVDDTDKPSENDFCSFAERREE